MRFRSHTDVGVILGILNRPSRIGARSSDPCDDCSSAEKNKMRFIIAGEDAERCLCMRFRKCARWYRERARSVARNVFHSITAIVHASGPLGKPWEIEPRVCQGSQHARDSTPHKHDSGHQSAKFRRMILAYSTCDNFCQQLTC
jgi:hypothetical protein